MEGSCVPDPAERAGKLSAVSCMDARRGMSPSESYRPQAAPMTRRTKQIGSTLLQNSELRATPVCRTESCSSDSGSWVTAHRTVASGPVGCCKQGALGAYRATDRRSANHSPVGRYQFGRVSELFR